KTHFLFRKPFAQPFVARPFYNLLSWEFLMGILESGHNDCWLPKNGKMPEDVALNTGRLSRDQARSGFENGHTLLIRHAELSHPALEAIAKDFFKVFKKPIDIQIYCTPEGAEGFGWHYDLEEVFVIQSLG